MKRILNVNHVVTNLLIASALFISVGAYAQANQPEKLRTANHDLRGEKAVFRVESKEEGLDSFALLETGNNQFMFDLSNGSVRMKVSGDFAQRADGEFVKQFIHLKYGMKKSEGDDCHQAFILNMRGENEKVCRHEKKKIGMITSILENLKKELKIK